MRVGCYRLAAEPDLAIVSLLRRPIRPPMSASPRSVTSPQGRLRFRWPHSGMPTWNAASDASLRNPPAGFGSKDREVGRAVPSQHGGGDGEPALGRLHHHLQLALLHEPVSGRLQLIAWASTRPSRVSAAAPVMATAGCSPGAWSRSAARRTTTSCCWRPPTCRALSPWISRTTGCRPCWGPHRGGCLVRGQHRERAGEAGGNPRQPADLVGAGARAGGGAGVPARRIAAEGLVARVTVAVACHSSRSADTLGRLARRECHSSRAGSSQARITRRARHSSRAGPSYTRITRRERHSSRSADTLGRLARRARHSRESALNTVTPPPPPEHTRQGGCLASKGPGGGGGGGPEPQAVVLGAPPPRPPPPPNTAPRHQTRSFIRMPRP